MSSRATSRAPRIDAPAGVRVTAGALDATTGAIVLTVEGVRDGVHPLRTRRPGEPCRITPVRLARGEVREVVIPARAASGRGSQGRASRF